MWIHVGETNDHKKTQQKIKKKNTTITTTKKAAILISEKKFPSIHMEFNSIMKFKKIIFSS